MPWNSKEPPPQKPISPRWTVYCEDAGRMILVAPDLEHAVRKFLHERQSCFTFEKTVEVFAIAEDQTKFRIVAQLHLEPIWLMISQEKV